VSRTPRLTGAPSLKARTNGPHLGAVLAVRPAWAIACGWKSRREEVVPTVATGKGVVVRRGPKEAR
jgi:hypothetical protein